MTLLVLYSLVILGGHKQDPNFLLKWEHNLHTILTQAEKDQVLLFAHGATLATTYQQSGYRILTHRYKTPQLFHKENPEVSPLC